MEDGGGGDEYGEGVGRGRVRVVGGHARNALRGHQVTSGEVTQPHN